MQPLLISHYTLTNALGTGLNATLCALRNRNTGLRPCDLPNIDLYTYIGRVPTLEEHPVTEPLPHFDCRNNRLAQLALQQDDFTESIALARKRYGPHRIGVIVGTSTSGILESEHAYRHRDPNTGALPASFRYQHAHNTFSVADFTRQYLELTGPALAISTACSSSAKVFANAYRMIMSGLCDAAVVGGVDTLCGTTLYGFTSLELVANTPCRPADANRNGLSIGEGAGFALLEKAAPKTTTTQPAIALLGYGESTDAYHMSSPHPEGQGAILAMQRALQRAELGPSAIDYLLLHGTATKTNDVIEDKAVTAVFGSNTPCSSIKGWTGHTLGAAGITNAIIGCLCLREGFAPASLNTEIVDPTFTSHILTEELRQPLHAILSNAFGFGGNNVSLILGRLDL